MKFKNAIWRCMLLLLLPVQNLYAQAIPTPKEHFGFDIGDNYMLANYTQAEAYYKKVAEISDRVLLDTIGKTEEGRNQYLIIISSPANLARLNHYRDISVRMARAEGVTEKEARNLANDGKAIVWIDGGLHATETVGSHQLIETLYQLASRNDAETRRILDDVIILLSQVNPDGQELVADWYMRNNEPEKREMNIPRLYQKYIGHDNNRDFYMNNMKESKNISRVLYIGWIPQILYNHHQSSPAGAVVAGPPYRDPFNYAYDPLLVTGIDGVGAAMANRLNAEDKPGFTRLSGSVFSTWWNGGLRTTAYFHNIIGLLTETWGSPAPSEIPLVPDRTTPSGATPNPVTPRKWLFKNSIDYSLSMNYAVLDYASRHSDELLYNIYKMGRNSIERGSRDHWTLRPSHTDSVKAIVARQKETRANPASFDSVYQAPQNRDPRGFIIPSGQKDFFSAIRFINALIESGIRVEKATSAFTVENKQYPAGSYVIRTNQAFRPHIIDMFEPQDHPNDFQYPGGPPVRPYDAAGWTPAFQMGFVFDRILNGFDGPFQAVPYGELQSPPGRTLSPSRGGYVLSAAASNTYLAMNDLLRAGIEIYRMPGGDIYVPAGGYNILKKSAATDGVAAVAASGKSALARKISPARIALYDHYGGSMPSGWTRWLLEQFRFPFDVIYPKDINGMNLNKKYDVILFVDAVIPGAGGRINYRQPPEQEIPPAYKHMAGGFSADTTLAALKNFLNNGGRVIAIGASTTIAYSLGLPVRNALTTVNQKGETVRLSPNDYFIPGSILTATVDTGQAENSGLDTKVDIVFNNSNVFALNPDAVSQGVRPLMWFGEEKPLKSGWAWGQSWVRDGVLAFAAPVGAGMLYAYSPQITFRAQPYGTFKMLFNQLYLTQ